MSQPPNNMYIQGSATTPMDNLLNNQERIMPPERSWCTTRRIIVIIAIVILSLLLATPIIALIAVAIASVNTRVQEYSSNGHTSNRG